MFTIPRILFHVDVKLHFLQKCLIYLVLIIDYQDLNSQNPGISFLMYVTNTSYKACLRYPILALVSHLFTVLHLWLDGCCKGIKFEKIWPKNVFTEYVVLLTRWSYLQSLNEILL